MLVVAILATLILELAYPLWWYAFYLTSLMVYTTLLSRAPRYVGRARLMLLLVLAYVTMMTILGTCLYMFSIDKSYTKHGAFMLYFAASLTTVSLRIRQPIFFMHDLAGLFTGAAGFVVIEFLRSGFDKTFYMLAMGMTGYCVYLTVMVSIMESQRRKVEAGRVSQIAAEHQRAIGQISAGVAHDFNNLLTVVLGNLELSREVKSDGEKHQLLAEAEAAARRGATLTSQLLAFSRKANLSPRVVSYCDIVDQLQPLAEGMLGRSHRLQVSKAADMPPLLIDSATLIAVLLNLILNAKEAMPNGGTIWLDAHMSNPEGDQDLMMCLRINDTGTGMSPQIREKIFEPFFSTKPPGQGSGLGLPMAEGFVEQSGGQISVNSTLGQGTEVILQLPVVEDEKQSPRAAAG